MYQSISEGIAATNDEISTRGPVSLSDQHIFLSEQFSQSLKRVLLVEIFILL